MVSIGPEDHHDHPARDPRALASGLLPSVGKAPGRGLQVLDHL
jgi:hypothetical protein